MSSCPICECSASVNEFGRWGRRLRVSCPRCGDFIITDWVIYLLTNNSSINALWRPKLSHWIRKKQLAGEEVKIDSNNYESILNEATLPSAMEQSDNLILWLGSALKRSEEIIDINPNYIAAVIGATDEKGVEYIASHLVEQRLIKYSMREKTSNREANLTSVGLTLDGWGKYKELKQGGRAIGFGVKPEQ